MIRLPRIACLTKTFTVTAAMRKKLLRLQSRNTNKHHKNMTPLPVNPTVVVLVDANNKPVTVASNIAPLPELNVQVVRTPEEFNEAALGKPFVNAVTQ